MSIKPDQMTAYDDASKEIEKAARLLEAINVARLNHDDHERIRTLVNEVRCARHEFYRAAHDCFLRERGFIKEEG
jgi:hypothetical protein